MNRKEYEERIKKLLLIKEKTYFCDMCNKLYIGEREIFLFYSERKIPLRVCESCADGAQ